MISDLDNAQLPLNSFCYSHNCTFVIFIYMMPVEPYVHARRAKLQRNDGYRKFALIILIFYYNTEEICRNLNMSRIGAILVEL